MIEMIMNLSLKKNNNGNHKKIYIGSDHAGFKLKKKIKEFFDKKKISYEDLGNLVYDKFDDYPDYAQKVAKAVVKYKTKGILFCGSAQGVCITANKIKGVRAVIPTTIKEAQLSRMHNDANILCLSGWHENEILMKKLVTFFLKTPFSGKKRHIRRINKIKKIETEEIN